MLSKMHYVIGLVADKYKRLNHNTAGTIDGDITYSCLSFPLCRQLPVPFIIPSALNLFQHVKLGSRIKLQRPDSRDIQLDDERTGFVWYPLEWSFEQDRGTFPIIHLSYESFS